MTPPSTVSFYSGTPRGRDSAGPRGSASEVLNTHVFFGSFTAGQLPVEPGEGHGAQAMDEYGGTDDEAVHHPCFLHSRFAGLDVGVVESRYPYGAEPAQEESISRTRPSRGLSASTVGSVQSCKASCSDGSKDQALAQ